MIGLTFTLHFLLTVIPEDAGIFWETSAIYLKYNVGLKVIQIQLQIRKLYIITLMIFCECANFFLILNSFHIKKNCVPVCAEVIQIS